MLNKIVIIKEGRDSLQGVGLGRGVTLSAAIHPETHIRSHVCRYILFRPENYYIILF